MDRVQIDELGVVDFRNIGRTVLKPGPRFNVVSGKNGSGKTNLVESIYLLGALRSFRTKKRVELIRKGAEAARVTGVFGQANAGMSLEMTIGTEGRKIKVDGNASTPGGDHFGRLPMVLFHPGNMELVQGGPAQRRRFLDRALFQAHPAYPDIHRSYARALSNRNSLLRNRIGDRRAMDPFDRQLVELGGRIIEMRRGFVASMSEFFAEAVGRISGVNSGALEYRPKARRDDLERALADAIGTDMARGFTSVGPHADELYFEIDGLDARRFASQGQQRTAVLAAKLAETRALEGATGRIPLLLLDDVSSELDRERNTRLFEFLAGVGGQVFVTTTHGDHISVFEDRVDFGVEGGRVERIGSQAPVTSSSPA